MGCRVLCEPVTVSTAVRYKELEEERRQAEERTRKEEEKRKRLQEEEEEKKAEEGKTGKSPPEGEYQELYLSSLKVVGA